MKVFISWSGEASRRIAAELFEWLPMVVQNIQPYMSAESIEKGARWATSISAELEGTSVGIVVLTPDNTTAPWINFEAGALAKVVDDTKLAPILFGLKPSDVGTPLSQFQVTLFNKNDILKLLKSINACGGVDALPESRLEKMHSALWGDLSAKIDPILAALQSAAPPGPKKPETETSQILEELLVLSRHQASSILNPEKLITPELIRLIVDISSEQGSPARQRRIRSMVRNLYLRWNNIATSLLLDETSGTADEQRAARQQLMGEFEGIVRELIDLVEQRPAAEFRRFATHESDKRIYWGPSDRSGMGDTDREAK